MTYLTVAQYRNMGFGVPETDDAKLAATLNRASADVNTYCAVPGIPVRHDFRGGSITGETHTWRVDPYDRSPRRKAWPYHTPVLEITTFRIHVTPLQYVEIDPTHVRYEPTEGWLEPYDAAFTSYGIFGAGVYPFMGASQPWIVLDYTYGYREIVNERLVRDATNQTWRASRGYWIDDPTVTVDGAIVVTGMTFDLVEGTVTFISSPPPSSATVEVSAVSSLPYDIVEATGMIAAAKLGTASLAAFQGLRDVTVAEVRLTRDQGRTTSGDVRANIPMEAQDKLAAYVFRTIR